jgi:hypothetical protein
MKKYEFKVDEYVKMPGYQYKHFKGIELVGEDSLTFDHYKILLERLEENLKDYPEIVQLMFINKLKRG